MKKKLENISIDITCKCNLKCKMCNLWEINKEGPSFDLILKTLKDAFDLGARSFSPCGCECFTRPDYIDILEYAEAIGYNHIEIVSNGVLINDEKISRLKNLKTLNINISIDGPQEIHDSLRGNGVYEKVIRNIHKLKANNISFSFSSIIMKKTLFTLKHIIDLASEFEIKSVAMQPFQINYTRNTDVSEFIFESKDKNLLSETLNEILNYSNKKNITIYNKSQFKDIPSFLCEGKFPRPITGCQMPSKFIWINLNGNIYPCFFLSNIRPLMGNLYENDLKEIWQSDIHKAYQEYALEKKCSGCLASCSDIETINNEMH